jgi:Arc/MetJ-type ribon-helix-helix transcriptional regulator
MATTISLSLPEDLYKWLQEEAEKEGKRIQEVIRDALEEIRAIRRYKLDKVMNIIENLKEAVDNIQELLEERR